jgi:hypothetical protein
MQGYTTKSQAVIDISQKTGYGRFVIEKKMSELVGAGRIRFVDDPGDSRRKLISNAHVDEVVRALTTIEAD